MSQREAILSAVATCLAALAGGRVYRSRREQLAELPAIVIEPISSYSTERVLGFVDHDMTFEVAVLAKADTPETGADATLVSAHALLLSDLTLGISADVQLDPTFESSWDYSDYDYVRAAHRYRVSYRTAAGAF